MLSKGFWNCTKITVTNLVIQIYNDIPYIMSLGTFNLGTTDRDRNKPSKIYNFLCHFLTQWHEWEIDSFENKMC